MLPGAMLRNRAVKFLSEAVHVRVERDDTIATAGLSRGTVLTMPIAHGEGNFYLPDEELDRLRAEGRVVFPYTTRDGHLGAAANANGGSRAVPRVWKARRNVGAAMAQPERAAEPEPRSADGPHV